MACPVIWSAGERVVFTGEEERVDSRVRKPFSDGGLRGVRTCKEEGGGGCAGGGQRVSCPSQACFSVGGVGRWGEESRAVPRGGEGSCDESCELWGRVGGKGRSKAGEGGGGGEGGGKMMCC